MLIEKIRVETNKNVSKELREFILDFSSDGFPWLLKRICAHIVTLINSGKTQQNIIDSSFQLEDLFSEELESLDEITRDFLLRAIYYMPATADELADVFAKEDRLKEHLALLQHHRLIRLTGRTYDTYNDVLKEYLKTGRISVSFKYVPRQFPKSIIKLFESIVENNLHSVEDVALEIGQRETIVRNIKTSDSAMRAYKQGALNGLIQSCLKQNGLVRQILKKLNNLGQLTHEQVVDIMKETVPFTIVSNETWSNYANIMTSWLKSFGLAYSKNNVLVLSTHTPFQEYSGLTDDEDFLPCSYMQHIHRLLMSLDVLDEASAKQLASELKRKTVQTVCQDATFLKLVEAVPNGYRLTDLGKKYVKGNDEQRKEILQRQVKELSYAMRIIEYLELDSHTNFKTAFSIVFKDKTDVWAESTTEWRRKLIGNWLTHSGLISKRKRKLT